MSFDGEVDIFGFGESDNLCQLVKKLNLLLRDHPAFFPDSHFQLIQQGPGNVIAALRSTLANTDPVLILLNLDTNIPQTVRFDGRNIAASGRDIISGRNINFSVSGSE